MDNQVKSGKEILEDFFNNIQNIENVDKNLAQSLADLYKENNLTEKKVINKLQELREQNGNKN
ncbi:MAG: hypothetical protein NUV74_01335 [Candidatus Brocadiaceae bacterium]|nr:hypothetical protein [Candidatus Brocadiaceae bacterium]